MSTASFQPLTYAPAAARRRRAWPFVLPAILIALLVAGRLWLGPAWRIGRALYWERVCMSLEPPPGSVAFEGLDFDRAAELLKKGGGYERRKLSRGQAAVRVAYGWRQLYAAVSPLGLKSDGSVFVHRRVSHAGHVRLVAVDLYLNDTPGYTSLSVVARVLRPSDGLLPPREVLGWSLNQGEAFRPNEHAVRVYAGVSDPADPSHFTFDFDVREMRVTIDGWLLDDDTVTIETRPSPVTLSNLLIGAGARE